MSVERRIRMIMMLERMNREADIASEIGIWDSSHYKNTDIEDIQESKECDSQIMSA